LSSIRKVFKESVQILFNRVKRSTSNVECKNKAGFLLEVRRSMLNALFHLFNQQSAFQNPKCVDSDSCLLTSLIF